MSPRTYVRLGAVATASISVALVLITGGCVDAAHKNSADTGSSPVSTGSPGSSVSTEPARDAASTGSPGSSVSTEPARDSVNIGSPGSSVSIGHPSSSKSTGAPETRSNFDASHRPGGDKVPHHAEPPVVASGPPPLTGSLPETPNVVTQNPSLGSGSNSTNLPLQNTPVHQQKHHKEKTR